MGAANHVCCTEKKQNQKIKFKGSDTDPDKICVHLLSFIAKYLGRGNGKDERYLKPLYLKDNIFCSCKITQSSFSVEHYLKICIHFGATGTNRTLGNILKCYRKYNECRDKQMWLGVNEKLLLKVTCLKEKITVFIISDVFHYISFKFGILKKLLSLLIFLFQSFPHIPYPFREFSFTEQ